MRLVQILLLLGISLKIQFLAAQNPFQGIITGVGIETITMDVTDVSNLNSWDEKMLEVKRPATISLLGNVPTVCTLTFYNNRLFEIQAIFPKEQFDLFYAEFQKSRGETDSKDLGAKEKSATWYGKFREDSQFTDILRIYEFYDHVIVSYSDTAQKDFQFKDMLRGSLFWVIVAIVGLFVLYFIVGYLLTSYCSNCRTFNLENTGKSFKNPQDYKPELFSQDIHWDEVHHYKCKKCGEEKDAVYSGFWAWYRSKGSR